jgi:hypothetical protein
MDPMDDPWQTARKVSDYLAEITSAEAALPHIVICHSSFNQRLSYSGPYASGLEAVIAADREQCLEQSADRADALSFTVAPLYPALDLTAIE